MAQSLSERPHYLDAFLGEMKRQAHLALIEQWGGVPAAGRVLKTDLFEEATGPDAFLLKLCGSAFVVGMDLSPVVARKAAGRDPEHRARYLAADTCHLPFADGAFALVVSPSTLDHFADGEDLGRSLRELARVLAPGGRLIVTLDNRDNILDPLLRLTGRLGLAPYFLGQSYRASELRTELEAAGLHVEAETAILHNPRLVAVGAIMAASHLGWPPLTGLVRRALVAAQAFGQTRWRYRTGSFIAALARKPA
jgi:SAM-dependent methyltransferase